MVQLKRGPTLTLINLYFILFFQLEYAFQESGLNDVITQTQVEVPHLNPTKVSKRMSCEKSVIFFPNLAYMSHKRQKSSNISTYGMSHRYWDSLYPQPLGYGKLPIMIFFQEY